MGLQNKVIAHYAEKPVVAGSKIYCRCAVCKKWVRANKLFFGALHVCK